MTHTPRRAAAWSRSIVLVCVAALALTGCTAAGTSPTTTPSSSATVKTILVIGDSIPYNSPDDCPGCVGFVESYARTLSESRGEPYIAENRSRHDGANTAMILTEVESGSLDGPLADADIVIISAGFNDLPPYGAGSACYTPGVDLDTPEGGFTGLLNTTPDCITTQTAATARHLAGVLAEVRADAPESVVLVLPAYNAWTGWPLLDAQPPEVKAAVTATVAASLLAWRTAVCDAAEAVAGQCVDLLTAFNGADGTQPSGDLLVTDYAHPSQAGNDLIRDELLKVEG